MSDGASPRYPVIAISPGDSFLVIDEPIRECSYVAWRNGYFDDLVLFDLDGRLWPTRAELRVRPRFFQRWTNRSLPVHVYAGLPRDDAHEDAVRLLERIVDDDTTDLYDSFVPRSELKALFRSAEDAEGLVSVARDLGAR